MVEWIERLEKVVSLLLDFEKRTRGRRGERGER
jgi:hypothetical protein